MLKRRKWLSLFLLLAVLLILSMIILSLMPGKQQGRSLLAEVFAPRASEVTVSELNFEVGRSRMFAHAGGSVASVGTLGLQVLGPDGRETLRESFRMTSPALAESNGRFLGYDVGGTAVRVFNNRDVLVSLETEGLVVSSSINGSGWICIVTQESSGGARGTVNVYNDSGRQVFRVIMGSGYVLSAILSDDNRCLAILSIADRGSVVTIYNGIDSDRDYPDHIYDLGSEIFIDIAYINGTDILAVGTRSVQAIDLSENSPAKVLYTFEDKRLGGYTYTEHFTALHLYDYNIGYSGLIVTIDFEGTVLGYIEVTAEITSMAAFGDVLALLTEGNISFYDKGLGSYSEPDGTISVATAGRVLALSEDLALAANDLSAVVVRRGVKN